MLRQEIKALDRLVTEQFRAHDEANIVALAAMDRRLNGMNELRGAMEEQGRLMLARSSYEVSHNALIDRITKLENQQSNWSGMQRGLALIATVFAGLVVWAVSGHHLP